MKTTDYLIIILIICNN